MAPATRPFRWWSALLVLALTGAGTSLAQESDRPRGAVPASRGLVVPDLDVFIPEGEFDLRLSRLINKVFFEGQVRYDFVDGDITAFLRYR